MVQKLLTPRGAIYHGYEDGQICKNGHVVNWYASTREDRNQDHCTKCGMATIKQCRYCDSTIRGVFHAPLAPNRTPSAVPNFCHNCGKPYPWMSERLQTARELLYNDDKLSQEDREKLWDLLKYVMSEPKSDLVPAKKKLLEIKLSKAAVSIRDALLDLLAKYAAEMSK